VFCCLITVVPVIYFLGNMLFVFVVSVYQATVEQLQEPSHSQGSTAFPFVWYKIPEDEVTSESYECEERQDERTALSSTLIDYVNEHKHDGSRNDDTLLSRDQKDADSRVLRDAGEVSVQQTDDAEILNSRDRVMTNSSPRLKNPGVEKTYACSVCDETFGFSRLLARHKRIHTGAESNASDECRNKGAAEQPYVCHICTRAFVEPRNLTKHMQVHSDDKRYKCDICHKKFAKTVSLRRHVVRRKGCVRIAEGPRTCNMCQKSFTKEASEYSDVCDVCTKTFVQSIILTMRSQTHLPDPNRLRCDVCNKPFRYRGSLESHVVDKHPAATCDVGSLQFTRRTSRKSCVRTRKEKIRHKCEICDKQFARRDNLKDHMLRHS